MRISELEAALAAAREAVGDLDVLYCLHSDFAVLKPTDLEVVSAWTKPGVEHVMRDHRSLSSSKPPRSNWEKRTFFCFPGN